MFKILGRHVKQYMYYVSKLSEHVHQCNAAKLWDRHGIHV